MKRHFFAAALAAASLFELINPVSANPQRPDPRAKNQAEIDRTEAELEAVDQLSWDTEGYKTFNLNLRNSAPSVDPLGGNFAPPGSVILKPNAFYGQLQTGTFGNNNPGDQWSAFGSPGPAVTGIYGLRYNWEQDFATFSLTNVSATRKDATIGFGSGTDTQLNFNFVNTTLAPTTVATIFPAAGLQVKSAARLGIENTNSELPIVSGSTGPSPLPGITTSGYIGVVTRRINDISLGPGNNGFVLARTDAITLQRDGTSGGLRVGYPVAAGSQNVACSGITSTGVVIGRAFIPVVEALPGPAVVTGNTIFKDSENVVSVHCTFGYAFLRGNLTTVDLQRFPGDYYWIGTLTSTYNQ